MRLKNINIDERSSTFKDIKQKKSLKEMSESINQLGEVFDNMVNLESFILHGIQDELSFLIGIRSDRKNIIQNQGQSTYLKEYFVPAVYKIENRIEELILEWNNAEDRLTTEEIKETIIVLKEVSVILHKIGKNKFKSLNILNDLIDEFGYFQVCKVIFTGDIVDRINLLTKLKNEVEQIFSPPKVNEPKEPAKRRKKLTIDDL
ncbi:MAG: hypothetical protein ACOC3V_04585 [bacterium]